MNVKVEGLEYEVDNVDKQTVQSIIFDEKITIPEKPAPDKKSGTTNKEVIRMLVDRLTYHNKLSPSNRRLKVIGALNNYLID